MKNAARDSILVLNAGSSSIKFQIFAKEPTLERLAKGKVYDLGNKPSFKVKLADNKTKEFRLDPGYHYDKALDFILDWIDQQKQHWQIRIAAHRVVHGGMRFTSSTIINPEVLRYLRDLEILAPLHQPHNLAAIDRLQTLKPKWIQMACFDTAFHAKHTSLYTQYALPQQLRRQDKKIRRYGFHGLSYEWIVQVLRQEHPDLAKKRLVVAHLGNGASLAAIHQGQSIDTTMGMTALDGLPMGTRCGQLDPGVVLYLIRDRGLSAEQTEELLYNESGLKGLSGWTNDVRLLQESKKPDAHFALDYFSLKTAQFIAMMAVSLGGMDALVFTGGIGENSKQVREKILARLKFLSPFSALVIPTNEERLMAQQALAID